MAPAATVFLLVLSILAVSATACEGGGGGEKELTSLSTKLSGESKESEELTVLEGSKVKDKATLAGKNAKSATGKVTYKVYSDKECKTLKTSAGEVTVSGESIPASSEEELEGGKAYYWQAHYGGDSKNAESTSPCTEILNVIAKTKLATKLSGESKEAEELTIIEGAKAKDTSTLTGTNSGSATGKVLYKIYSEKECKTLVKEAGEVALESNAKIPPSTEVELEAGRTYYWQATYKGDALHRESTSSCGSEKLSVQAKTTLATKLSGESKEAEELTVEEEQPVHDTATLSGTNSSTATGKVIYRLYAEDECKEIIAEAGEVTLEASGKIPSSLTKTLSSGAYYYWQAAYSGDSLHQASTSPCGTEVELVADKTTLTTSLTGETSEEKHTEGATLEVAQDAPVADAAVLHGKNASLASGTVTYNIYSDSECKHLVLEASQESVSGEVVTASLSATLTAGTYYWQAAYSGNALNQPSTSKCGSEVETVVSPPITTSLTGESKTGEFLEVQESAEVSDAATLHSENPSTATGTVTYAAYFDSECTKLAGSAGKVIIESGGKIPPSSKLKLSAGSYYWRAVYSGDASHKERSSTCGTEVEVVADTTSIKTSLKGEEKSGEALEVHEQTPVADTATLSGSKASTATGTLAYNVYSDNKCEHLYENAGEVLVTGGSAPSSLEVSLPPGIYYWQAEYTGDASNQHSTSTCGTEVETVLGLTTSLSGGEETGEVLELEEEAPVSDVATLHSPTASTATGAVEYDIYSDSKCEHLVESAGEGTMKEGVASASESKALAIGTYYWQANYKGDSKHPAQKSACGKEEEKVLKGPTAWVVSVGDSYISGEGGRWAGNTILNTEWPEIDALGKEAYDGYPNEEWKPGKKGQVGEEEIPQCHRSKSAEVFFGGGIGVKGKNFACSGAETTSENEEAPFRPGLDEIEVKKGQNIEVPPNNTKRGKCSLQKCVGQVKKLEEFAKTHTVKAVVVSIGGNDFKFGPVVTACVKAFAFALVALEECHESEKAKFEEPELKKREAAIVEALDRIGAAMKNAGYNKAAYTIIVQDYPSPIPGKAKEFRYEQREGFIWGPFALGINRPTTFRINPAIGSFRSREALGACPFLDKDAEWASNEAQKAINSTVFKAYKAVKEAGIYPMAFMQLEGVFSPNAKEKLGRRLCEKGLKLIGGEGPKRGAPLKWAVPGKLPKTVDETEWINQVRIRTYKAMGLILPVGTPFEKQEDFHPNFWGQLALRNCLRKEYKNGAPAAEGTCTIEKAGLTGVPGGPPPTVNGEPPIVRNEPLMELTEP